MPVAPFNGGYDAHLYQAAHVPFQPAGQHESPVTATYGANHAHLDHRGSLHFPQSQQLPVAAPNGAYYGALSQGGPLHFAASQQPPAAAYHSAPSAPHMQRAFPLSAMPQQPQMHAAAPTGSYCALSNGDASLSAMPQQPQMHAAASQGTSYSSPMQRAPFLSAMLQQSRLHAAALSSAPYAPPVQRAPLLSAMLHQSQGPAAASTGSHYVHSYRDGSFPAPIPQSLYPVQHNPAQLARSQKELTQYAAAAYPPPAPLYNPGMPMPMPVPMPHQPWNAGAIPPAPLPLPTAAPRCDTRRQPTEPPSDDMEIIWAGPVGEPKPEHLLPRPRVDSGLPSAPSPPPSGEAAPSAPGPAQPSPPPPPIATQDIASWQAVAAISSLKRELTDDETETIHRYIFSFAGAKDLEPRVDAALLMERLLGDELAATAETALPMDGVVEDGAAVTAETASPAKKATWEEVSASWRNDLRIPLESSVKPAAEDELGEISAADFEASQQAKRARDDAAFEDNFRVQLLAALAEM